MLETEGVVLDTASSWSRYCRVRIYRHTVTPVITNADNYLQEFSKEVSGDVVLDVSQLRIVFEVKRFAMMSPNNALITIYNLTAGTERDIVKQGYRITIEAGYADNHGQIFDGNILMCNRWKQSGTDYILQVLALDGSQLIDYGFCSFTYQKGITGRAVVDEVARLGKTTVGYVSPSLDKLAHTKSVTVHGASKNILSDYAKTIKGTWFVDNGKLYVIGYGDESNMLPMGMQAIELSEKTGLLGNPSQNEQGINARALINPQFMPYGLVHVRNDRITQQLVSLGSYSAPASFPYPLDTAGVYRIVSIVFKGDTRGNDWYADLVTISQVGKIPEMLTYN